MLMVTSAYAGDDPCGEPNDRTAAPCALEQDVEVQGFISSFDDEDAYRIDMPAGANLRVDMTPPGDYRVGLIRADGSEVVKPQGEGVAPRQFRVAKIGAGTYFIQVTSARGDSSPDLAYKVSYTLEPDAAGPSGGELVQARPQDLVLTLNEAGKQAKKGKTDEGTGDTGAWYQIEYERPRTYANDRSGATRIVERIVVAPDVGAAQKAFRELTSKEFPDATSKRVGKFIPSEGPLGDEFSIIGSCNTDGCSDKEPDVHHQIVVRHINVVFRLYTFGYGGDGGANTDNAMILAELALKHLK